MLRKFTKCQGARGNGLVWLWMPEQHKVQGGWPTVLVGLESRKFQGSRAFKCRTWTVPGNLWRLVILCKRLLSIFLSQGRTACPPKPQAETDKLLLRPWQGYQSWMDIHGCPYKDIIFKATLPMKLPPLGAPSSFPESWSLIPSHLVPKLCLLSLHRWTPLIV